jgi:hypothetical protein
MQVSCMYVLSFPCQFLFHEIPPIFHLELVTDKTVVDVPSEFAVIPLPRNLNYTSRGIVVDKTLSYKPEGRGFETR